MILSSADMFRRINMRCILTISFLVLFAGGLFAQPAPQPQPQTGQDVDKLMNEIHQKMKNLEQDLAKASLEPSSIKNVLSQLLELAKQNKLDSIPNSVKDFFLANPEMLAKLKNPNADQETLRSIEDNIRRKLAEDEKNLAALLQENPQILQNLMNDENALKNAMEKYTETENDLKKLFDDTSSEMKSTEDEIKKLIEMAQQMQNQMNKSAEQQKEQLQQEKEREEQQGEHKNDNGSVNDPKDPAKKELPNGGAEQPKQGNRNNVFDPRAWDAFLPKAILDAARTAAAEPAPSKYQLEANRYFQMLAKAARLERERRERQERENPKEETPKPEQK